MKILFTPSKSFFIFIFSFFIFAPSTALAVEVEIYPGSTTVNANATSDGWTDNHLLGQGFVVPAGVNQITRVRLTNFKLGWGENGRGGNLGGIVSVALFPGEPIVSKVDIGYGITTTRIEAGNWLVKREKIFIGDQIPNQFNDLCGLPDNNVVTYLLKRLRINNPDKPCPKKSEWIRMWDFFVARGWGDLLDEWVNGRDGIDGWRNPYTLNEGDFGVGDSDFLWPDFQSRGEVGAGPTYFEGSGWAAQTATWQGTDSSDNYLEVRLPNNAVNPGQSYFLSIQQSHLDPNRDVEGGYYEQGRYNCEGPNNDGPISIPGYTPGGTFCGKENVFVAGIDRTDPYSGGQVYFNTFYYDPANAGDAANLTIWGNQAPPPPPPPPSGELDCTNPVSGPLTYSPMDGPSFRVVFRGSGEFIDSEKAGVECTSGKGQYSTVTWQGSLSIQDLESIFANYIADYLEGEFQDPALTHQQENLLNLTSSQWNDYNGPAQKLTPKIIFNQEFGPLSGLKIRYVNYAIDPQKATRQDAKFTYTDIYGRDPVTIQELYQRYGFPNPPSSNEDDWDKWKNEWGRYWDKIPIAANDITRGKIKTFPYPVDISGNPQTNTCPRNPNEYDIVVPEYFRTNLTAAHLNQLLLPAIAQSPLADQSSKQTLAQADLGSTCHLPTQSPHSTASQSLPTNLLASSQINTPIKTSVRQSTGEVLAESVDMSHNYCQIPSDSDPGSGRKYCLPDQVLIGPATNEIFVCAARRCVTISPPPIGCNPVSNPGCDINCFFVPGEKTVDIPTSIVLGIPYLESIWNKTTSNQDNKRSGFWAAFTPSLETGVLLNQTQFEKYGQTPETEYQGQAANATFPPNQKGTAYPDFIAGVKNAENWVRQALWPAGLSSQGPSICSTTPCPAGSDRTEYNTICDPDCASPNRTCRDSPSCENNPPNCNDPGTWGGFEGPDEYCANIQTGGCGPSQTCTVFRVCEAGGNCVTRCEDCR